MEAARCARAAAVVTRPVRTSLLPVFLVIVLLGAFDPGAGERGPSHAHIVIGGTPDEQARALAAHLRGAHSSATSHAWHVLFRASDEATDHPHVISISTGAVGASVLGVGDGTMVAAPASRVPRAPLSGRVVPLQSAAPAEADRTVPDPPPRLT
ncbi:MAG: hypothetical protein QN168_04140 [Armatimonadota bacterium]|nr:hypothetical protein [Armatimonadota bacterium]